MFESLPIYILNLKKDKKKWNMISANLTNQEITHFQRFEGTLGTEIPQEEYDKYISPDFKTSNKNLIGCAYSYKKLFEHIYENNKENSFVLIMEDTFIPLPNLKEKINNLIPKLIERNIDYTNLFRNMNHKVKGKLLDDTTLSKDCIVGPKCAIYSRKLINHLGNKLKKINKPFDVYVCEIPNINRYVTISNYYGSNDYRNSTLVTKSPYFFYVLTNNIDLPNGHPISRELLYSTKEIMGYKLSLFSAYYGILMGMIFGLFMNMHIFLSFLVFVFLFDFIYFKISLQNVGNSLINILILYIGFLIGKSTKKLVINYIK